MFQLLEDGQYKEICNADELAKRVKDTIEYYEQRTNALHDANTELRENATKLVKHEYEDKINTLKHRLSLSWGEFASEKELEAYNAFTEKHMHNRRSSRVNGGLVPYIVPNYTGLGCLKKVVCQICGEKEDITDMEVW